MKRLTWILAVAMLLSEPALAFPDSPVDAAPYGGLSPLELRAANAAAGGGAGVALEQVPTNLGYFGTLQYWRLVNGPVAIYDAPGGSPVNSIDEGFNFITVLSWEGDWAQINYGQWVYRPDHLEPAQVSEFSGVLTPPYPERLFGWMLLHTKPSPAPGAAPLPGAEEIPRYARFTVYTTAQVGEWEWYLIGPDQWIEQRRVSVVKQIDPPEGVHGRWVAVDLYEQNAAAYEDDRMVFATLVSSGLSKWPTQKGLFEVWDRVEDGEMSGAEGQPDFYYLENVPWTLYFDEGRSLHGTYWHDWFGYRHSHGCVNLSITDAAWIYNWVEQDHTWVYVYSTGEYVK